MRSINILFLATSFFVTIFLIGSIDKKIPTANKNNQMAASVFFTQSTTTDDLRGKFNAAATTKKKLNILIVPGHEPDYGGAAFKNIKERDLNVELGFDLAQYLIEDGHYNVTITRGTDGWNPIFESYFLTHADEIKAFVDSQKAEMTYLTDEGKITKTDETVIHNEAPDDVALRLFGINKWANEQKMDIVIHVHFNDDASRVARTPGEYNGFTMYVPDHQYSNAQASMDVAESVLKRLSKMFPVSSLPQEHQGVIQDQNLIAIGSNNTADAAVMLIEYGYIYEPQFQTKEVRTLALKELAFQTYLGLADFFGETSLVVGPYQSTLLPFRAETIVEKTKQANKGVLFFQAALADKGFYPPESFTKNDCPISGLYGPCTQAALEAFQNKYNIKKENDVVGEKTRATLQKLFEPHFMSINNDK